MFDARSDDADSKAFAERCEDDRHHFRFTVSPEDAAEMADLRAFTRELMKDAERDLGTGLDWVAVDHWNTDNPHIHVLVRGRADDGKDLVISRDYISQGLSATAPPSASRWSWGRAASRKSARPWRRRSRPSAGPASIARCATSPTRAAASPTCAPAAPAKTPNCAG
jgi:type IV secretory pathway VirD2 relaxase